MDYQEFYKVLFTPLVKQYGELDNETLTSIIGFSAGGPVSLSTNKKQNLFVTCELATYPEQQLSSEGIRYELYSVGQFPAEWCSVVFTAIGNLSLNKQLGDRHTIDISDLMSGSDTIDAVQLRLFSQTSINNQPYGLYEVSPHKPV